MIDELLANPWWIWLSLGGLLLAAETVSYTHLTLPTTERV